MCNRIQDFLPFSEDNGPTGSEHFWDEGREEEIA